MSKKWWIVVIVCPIVLLLLLLIILWNYGLFDGEDQTQLTYRENLTVECYESVKLSDFVVIDQGELIEDKEIDTTDLGKKEISFAYWNSNHRKRKGKFTLDIVDTTVPYVALNNRMTVVVGSDRDLEKEILCADNYDRNPDCHIVGNYDLNQIGTYELTFEATDQSANKRNIPFTLSVIEQPSENNSYEEPTQPSGTAFQKIIESYKQDHTQIGIDVSKWQGKIDWEKVKESGVEFAIIRLGTQKDVGKDSRLDPYFEENIEKAKQAGIPVGVYYFSYASSVSEAKTQAKWVVEQLKDRSLELPIAFDWETFSIFNDLNISIYNLNEIAEAFIKEVEKEGYDGILYSSKNYLENMWTYHEEEVWLAHYTDQTNYEGDYAMWQLSNTGLVPGIEGYVDINVLYLGEEKN